MAPPKTVQWRGGVRVGQSEKEESSTIASEMDEGEEDSTFDFQWGETLDELDTEGSPTASAHRNT